MIAQETRTTMPALAASTFRGVAFLVAWTAWSIRLHMAERHGLPRASAGEPPAEWLRPKRAAPRLRPDAYGRWTLGGPAG